MTAEKRTLFYKISISLIFGLLGFYSNFHTIIFQFGEFTIAILFGLIFPLLITLSWGWKYGLLSALAGGCQSMWWLWGPSNGYAVFLAVPPFTLWVLWHGFLSDLRKKADSYSWKLNMYLLEIPFRALSILIIFTVNRWAISMNPPPWSWAINSVNSIPMEFSIFVAVKQTSIAFILLLIAEVLLNINPVRFFFRLEPLVDQKRTGYVASLSLLIGCLYWILDSFYYTYIVNDQRSFIDYFIRDIPESNLFTRIVFYLFCLGFGTAMPRILRKQRRDELELQKAKEEAVHREDFLRFLFQTLPDLVWVKDINGKYISINKRVEDLFGLKELQIIGKTDDELIDKETAEKFNEQDRQVIESERLSVFETHLTFKSDGHQELSETIKSPMYDNTGKFMGVIGIGRDISLRTSLQKQLIQAQKMESIGRLAGGVAHDFNNMITVILGVSEIVMSDLPEADPLIENMKSIKNAAERSGKLTGQLLAFARQQTISLKVINLNNAVDDILKLLRRLIGENISLEWFPVNHLWKVKADSAQIDQILANLCVNAGDAITSNGKIIITTENTTFDAEYCSSHEGITPGDYVMISVSDTGSGMSRGDQEHIFEPFYTTKQVGKGTGLGLATVYGIVKQHQGFINVYSEIGRGSTFKLYFPRYIGRNKGEEIPEADRRSNKGNEKILLVEDEETIQRLLKIQLESLGYQVMSFSNSLEAIKQSEGEGGIDLLISDVIMPDLNGKEVFHAVQKMHPRIKCLFISGYTADIIAEQGILDEGLFFLSKPFSKSALAEKVREILEKDGLKHIP